MPRKKTSDVLFSPTVKAWQDLLGSRPGYEKMEEKGKFRNTIDDYLSAFLADRNSFYLATTSADGQPYIQHRGGKKGFLKVIDSKTLAFADFKGNRQYISAGNLSDNPKAYIFLMDYAHRRRIKIWGEARVIEDDPALLKKLTDRDYPGIVERAIVFNVTAWDINCPQHIPVKFDQEDVEELLASQQSRISELEKEIENLQARS